MRVKIRDTWYDSKDEPICIEISEFEQKQIAQMDRKIAQHGRYAVFPESWSQKSKDEKIKWMS